MTRSRREILGSPADARWRRRSSERPDEILDAALAEFLANGFDSARMDDVAARAGLSKAGVYLYFDSKTALLHALIDREVKPIARRAEAMMRAGHADPVATLNLLANFARGVIAQPGMLAVPRLVISIATRFPDLAQHYRREVVERALGALAGLIAEGIEKGVFRPVDPVLAARVMAGPMIVEALWLHILGGDALSTDHADTAMKHLDLLMNGLIRKDAP